MASLLQIIQQIRFELHQLGVKNAHHEFEHMCRHYTRTRICKNILPASGPVSSGGDQGRDFESFRTYLSQSPLANSAFIGKVAEGPMAFACTLQQSALTSKIKTDVETIMESGTQVLGIHYFCVANLPVGERHKLQGWARENHSVELDIHDGEGIAENLAEKDVFWIAAQYLNIPSEIYPRDIFPVDESYEQAKTKWEKTQIDSSSFLEFHEIKGLLRHSKSDETVKQDLPFWISLIQKFTGSDCPRLLSRKAGDVPFVVETASSLSSKG